MAKGKNKQKSKAKPQVKAEIAEQPKKVEKPKKAVAKPTKSGKQAGAPKKPALVTRIRAYFVGVLAELKRVVWPSRQEVINSTIIVVVTLIFFGIFTFVIDWLSSGGVEQLLKLSMK